MSYEKNIIYFLIYINQNKNIQMEQKRKNQQQNNQKKQKKDTKKTRNLFKIEVVKKKKY